MRWLCLCFMLVASAAAINRTKNRRQGFDVESNLGDNGAVMTYYFHQGYDDGKAATDTQHITAAQIPQQSLEHFPFQDGGGVRSAAEHRDFQNHQHLGNSGGLHNFGGQSNVPLEGHQPQAQEHHGFPGFHQGSNHALQDQQVVHHGQEGQGFHQGPAHRVPEHIQQQNVHQLSANHQPQLNHHQGHSSHREPAAPIQYSLAKGENNVPQHNVHDQQQDQHLYHNQQLAQPQQQQLSVPNPHVNQIFHGHHEPVNNHQNPLQTHEPVQQPDNQHHLLHQHLSTPHNPVHQQQLDHHQQNQQDHHNPVHENQQVHHNENHENQQQPEIHNSDQENQQVQHNSDHENQQAQHNPAHEHQQIHNPIAFHHHQQQQYPHHHQQPHVHQYPGAIPYQHNPHANIHASPQNNPPPAHLLGPQHQQDEVQQQAEPTANPASQSLLATLLEPIIKAAQNG